MHRNGPVLSEAVWLQKEEEYGRCHHAGDEVCRHLQTEEDNMRDDRPGH